MKVSVVIAVYNAADFLPQAIESALAQPETLEVVLVEDGSTDSSLEVCNRFVEADDRVRVFQHEGGVNRGESASRNLGIRQAASDYVAFLDADDYYLPDRFAATKTIFEQNPDVEGVYEAVGVTFQDEEAERSWRSKTDNDITTVEKRVEPERLFYEQTPIGNAGHAQMNGWVVKREVFEKAGYFDEELKAHPDTAMIVKFAGVCRMRPGEITRPVAIRRVHGSNQWLVYQGKTRYMTKTRMWVVLWQWGRKHLDHRKYTVLMDRFMKHAARPYMGRDFADSLGTGTFMRRLYDLAVSKLQLSSLLARHCALALEPVFWKWYLKPSRW